MIALVPLPSIVRDATPLPPLAPQALTADGFAELLTIASVALPPATMAAPAFQGANLAAKPVVVPTAPVAPPPNEATAPDVIQSIPPDASLSIDDETDSDLDADMVSIWVSDDPEPIAADRIAPDAIAALVPIDHSAALLTAVAASRAASPAIAPKIAEIAKSAAAPVPGFPQREAKPSHHDHVAGSSAVAAAPPVPPTSQPSVLHDTIELKAEGSEIDAPRSDAPIPTQFDRNSDLPRPAAAASAAAWGIGPARLSDARMLETLRTSVDLESVANDIMAASIATGRAAFRVATDNLGLLGIGIDPSPAGLAVHITTYGDEAASIIAAAQPRLHEDLRAHGLRVNEQPGQQGPPRDGQLASQRERPPPRHAVLHDVLQREPEIPSSGHRLSRHRFA